jgi:hypothetical protein
MSNLSKSWKLRKLVVDLNLYIITIVLTVVNSLKNHTNKMGDSYKHKQK